MLPSLEGGSSVLLFLPLHYKSKLIAEYPTRYAQKMLEYQYIGLRYLRIGRNGLCLGVEKTQSHDLQGACKTRSPIRQMDDFLN